MQGMNSLFAYIGPETIVPATSVIAAVGGFLLAFGKNLLRPVIGTFYRLIGKKPAATPETAPIAEPSVATGESQPTMSCHGLMAPSPFPNYCH